MTTRTGHLSLCLNEELGILTQDPQINVSATSQWQKDYLTRLKLTRCPEQFAEQCLWSATFRTWPHRRGDVCRGLSLRTIALWSQGMELTYNPWKAERSHVVFSYRNDVCLMWTRKGNNHKLLYKPLWETPEQTLNCWLRHKHNHKKCPFYFPNLHC